MHAEIRARKRSQRGYRARKEETVDEESGIAARHAAWRVLRTETGLTSEYIAAVEFIGP